MAKKTKVEPIVGQAAIRGLGESVASGLRHGTLNFTYQPGKIERHRVYDKDGKHYHMSVPTFHKSDHFPNGIYWSFPAWFVALIGLPMLAKVLGGLNIGGIFDGLLPGSGDWYPGKAVVENVQKWGGVYQEPTYDLPSSKKEKHKVFDYFISIGIAPENLPPPYNMYEVEYAEYMAAKEEVEL